MRFDLKQFLRTGRVPYEAPLECDLAGFDWPGYALEKPVQGRFHAQLDPRGRAELELTASASVVAPCARCLEDAHYSCQVRQSWVIDPDKLAENEWELPLDGSGVLDVDELVFQELVLEIPPVLLCSPDCQGLCPVCGRPKAAGCSCCAQEAETPAANQGLAILKQLLSEDSH